MTLNLLHGFQIASLRVKPLTGQLIGADGKSQHLEPKAMDTLVFLAENIGELVTRQQILDAVWGERAVSDEPLTGVISTLRRAISETKSGDNAIVIQTIPKRGYRLVGTLALLTTDEKGIDTDRQAIGKRATGRTVVITSMVAVLAAILLWASGVIEHDKMDQVDSAANVEPDRKTIAVLPFVDLSQEGGNKWFGDGIAAEIIGSLTRIPDFQVTARTSSFIFRERSQPIPEIGRALGVDYLVEGSLRRNGESVRINYQLIRASDGFHIFAGQYDGSMAGVLEIQGYIAARVAENLSVVLDTELRQIVVATGTDSPRAYQLFLQAKYFNNTETTAEAMHKAVALLERALEEDPNYVSAIGLLAGVYMNLAQGSEIPWSEAIPKTRSLNRKALKIDPDDAEIIAMEARFEFEIDGDFPSAAEKLQWAVTLEPRHPTILNASEALLQYLGRHDESIVVQKYLAARNPMAAITSTNLMRSYMAAGDFDSAATVFRDKNELLDVDDDSMQYIASVALSMSGNGEDGLQSALRIRNESMRVYPLALAQQTLGNTTAYEATLEKLKQSAESNSDATISLALLYGHAGDLDTAFDWFDRFPVPAGPKGKLFIHRDIRLSGNLRMDPRFDRVRERIGFPQAELDGIEFSMQMPE